MKNYFIIFFASIIISFAPIWNSYSQTISTDYDFLLQNYIFSLNGGMAYGFSDYTNSSIGPAIRGSFEYYPIIIQNARLGFKVFAGGLILNFDDPRNSVSSNDGPRVIPNEVSTDAIQFGAGLSFGYALSELILSTITAGVTYLSFNPKNSVGNRLPFNAQEYYDKGIFSFNIEGELKIKISEKLSVNTLVSYYPTSTDYLEDVSASTNNDTYITGMIGLSYALSGSPDSDNDGVLDIKDQCPNTPKGVIVDEFGCPVDTDKDGVPDYIDECPGTPIGATVDQKGCPLDSDGDGIVDSEDMCPETPYGVSVDEFGCPEGDEIVSEQKFTIPGDNIFPPNSAMIKIEGKKNLDEVILQLQKFTDKKWRIEGYMDSVGDTKSLMTLSLERAKAVLEYFSFFGGLNRENFQVFGMGGNYPLGDNNTEEGRKQNRRIEIVPEAKDIITDSIARPEEEFNQFILRGDDSFESNTATLKELAKILLDEIAAYIKNQPESRWRIEGYTDSQGTASLQKKITSERAYAIYDYLISEGLSADQITASGLGSSNPIANNDTQEGRSANRRIIIIRED